MDVAKRSWVDNKALDLLAGIHLGVLGGVLMLIWFAISSPLIGQPWWIVPNLFASGFFGLRAIRLGPGMATVVGSALHLCAAALVGAIAGSCTPGNRLSGLAVSLAWYLLCLAFLWKRTAPLVLLTASQPLMAAGYFVFGSALGWHSQVALSLRNQAQTRLGN